MIFKHNDFVRGDKKRCLKMRSIVKKPNASKPSRKKAQKKKQQEQQMQQQMQMQQMQMQIQNSMGGGPHSMASGPYGMMMDGGDGMGTAETGNMSRMMNNMMQQIQMNPGNFSGQMMYNLMNSNNMGMQNGMNNIESSSNSMSMNARVAGGMDGMAGPSNNPFMANQSSATSMNINAGAGGAGPMPSFSGGLTSKDLWDEGRRLERLEHQNQMQLANGLHQVPNAEDDPTGYSNSGPG